MNNSSRFGPDGPLAPPRATDILGEMRGPLEFVRAAAGWPALPNTKPDTPKHVMLIPGFMADDLSMIPLRSFLERTGHRPFSWGLGRNSADVEETVWRVADQVEQAASELDGPLVLLGWSLGGYLAREAARERPDLVSRVITLGSPVTGGPKYTAVAPYYRLRGVDIDEIERKVEEREAVPLKVPVTAIFSRSDGVVAWQASIDRKSPRVEHVEVEASHFGLGVSADAYRIISDRLSAP